MPTNVTQLVNDYVQKSNANASVKSGIASTTAFFGAVQSGDVNASTLVNALPPGAQANITAATSNLTANLSSSTSNNANANLGPDDARKTAFTQGANRILLEEPDVPASAPLTKIKDNIPTLLSNDVKALMVQIAYIASDWNTTYNEPPLIGRYAVHTKTLQNYGYINNSGAYLGKDGINGQVDFCFDNLVQDRIMERFLQDQYAACIKSGAIRANDDKETVAGILAVAYQFQDAAPSLSSISSVISGIAGSISSVTGSIMDSVSSLTSSMNLNLTSAATAISTSLSVGSTNQTLNAASGNTSTNANLQAVQSNIAKATSLISAFTGTNPEAAAAMTGLFTITAAAASANRSQANLAAASITSTLSNSVKSGLPASLTSNQSQAKLFANKVDVSNLKSKAADFASSLPASKAAEWRKTGKDKDSLGRPGSLYYNAGRYAIGTLAADITVATAASLSQAVS